MKYWEIIADKIAASGSTWGYCSAMTPQAGVISLTPVAGRRTKVHRRIWRTF